MCAAGSGVQCFRRRGSGGGACGDAGGECRLEVHKAAGGRDQACDASGCGRRGQASGASGSGGQAGGGWAAGGVGQAGGGSGC
jgi:hypothetical protein